MIAAGAGVLASRQSDLGPSAAVPPGMKPVSFHGITIDVPKQLAIDSGGWGPQLASVRDLVFVGDPTASYSCPSISSPIPPPMPVGGFESALLSRRLTDDYAAALADALPSSGRGGVGSGAGPESADWVVFRYADGSTRTLAVDNQAAIDTWTDGTHPGDTDVKATVGGLPD